MISYFILNLSIIDSSNCSEQIFIGAIIGWSELYDGASIETKKMIVNCLIKRIDVYRGYRVHIDFNMDFDQFQFGLDFKAKTA